MDSPTPKSRVALAAVFLLCAAGYAFSRLSAPPAVAHAQENPASARKIYSDKVSEHYFAHFDDKSPFLPSNATTDTGQFLDPSTIPTAAYCSHCHQAAHAQWRQSAHANSFRAPWYKTNVQLLMDTKGVEYARHCEGCHNPIALLSGSMTKGVEQKRKTDDDGITCMVCHSLRQAPASQSQRGTGSYVMAQPAVLVDEAGQPILGKVSDLEILSHLDRHSKAVMRDFYRTPEYCAVCHKAALPTTLNDYKWQRAIFLSDEWQLSSFAKRSPLPFYVKDSVSTCQTCHMAREKLAATGPESRDAGSKDGTLVSHRWLGANTLIPTYYNYPDQLAKTEAFLKAGVFNVDLFAIEKENDPALIAPLGSVPFTIAPGDVVTTSVVIQNKGAAHSHVPEQRDMYESWVEFQVTDSTGKAIEHSGFLKPDGALDERAHSFTNRLINDQSTLNAHHEVWTNHVVAYNNTVQSGRSQVVRYQFKVPADAKGPLTITAQVDYRRFNQTFIDWAMKKKHYPEPVVVMASRTRTLSLGANPPTPPDPADNKEWMRWNNYGIGLLDAQQYAASEAAFQHVAKLRPDYPDAFTNIALADFQWERYDASRESLAKALKLAPTNARALYYLALVDRNQGDLDAAIEDLQAVIKQYPLSRDAHRELGFSFYQQHKYDLARAEYEAVQGIDPDDLAAHYNLAILYRRLGLKEQAAVEAAAFKDQKDDPLAATFALTFLRNHSEIAEESVPWHVHTAEGILAAPGAMPQTFSQSATGNAQ